MRWLGVLGLVVGCSFNPGTLTSDPVVDAAPTDPDAIVDPGTPELCNGIDDDLDLSIDEDFALGMPCDGADGDLCTEGQIVCAADGMGTECNDTSDTTAEVCTGSGDVNCDGYAGCADQSCSGDAACTNSGYFCTGSGLVHTASNTCTDDFGLTGSSDSFEVYCCDGIARFCLSKEACPWRGGCGAPTQDTCSRSGLQNDAMAVLTCSLWQSKTTFNCSPANRIYFP